MRQRPDVGTPGGPRKLGQAVSAHTPGLPVSRRHTLENSRYRIDCDMESGRLMQVRDKAGGYDLISDPRLAENYRLLVPLPDMEANYVLGIDQHLTGSARSDDTLELSWAGPLRSAQGEFNLDVRLCIELVGDEVRFRMRVHNGTPYRLDEVWFGILGGMTGLGNSETERRETAAMVPIVNSYWQQPLFSDFGNTRGQTLGVPGAEHAFAYPSGMTMPWVSLYNPGLGRGFYYAALEETPRVKLLGLALEPGIAQNRTTGNWPRPEEAGDLPRGITMQWTHVPFTPPGETFESATVVLACHEGGWREAGARYRAWFTARYPPIEPGSTWIRRETAAVHTMFMLPEDNINLRFTDIPHWGEAAHRHGVGHVMIAGWNIGGHDRGYPQYEPDPRLGTWQELEDGIRACHALGLRVSFFVNCQPVDMTTDWYKRELHQYAILDPHGLPYYIVNYWGMGTLSARSRFFTATPFTEISPAHPEVRELLIRRMRRLIEIGADGLHLDKFFQTPLDFNPRLTHTSPDRAHHEGILRFVEELTAACQAVNPEFCLSYEGGWDRLLSAADTLWWGGKEVLLKEVFPQLAMTTGVEQPYDFNRLNEAVLRGENLLIGPANYTRALDYPPMSKLAAYIGEITRLRKQLFDTVSLGERVSASHGVLSPREPAPRIETDPSARGRLRWSVFRNVTTRRRAAVLANAGLEAITLRSVAFADRPRGACTLYQPFCEPISAAGQIRVDLPGERAAFMVEEV